MVTGADLKRLRLERGLLQKQLAHALGFADGNYISALEIGQRKIGPRIEQRILKYLAEKVQEPC